MKTVDINNSTNKLSESMKVAFKYSIWVTLCAVAIFLISKIFHLEKAVALRFINYIALFFISYKALDSVYNSQDKKLEYANGFLIAFLTGVLGFLWYSVLFYFYLHLDPGFATYLADQFSGKMIYPELSVSFAIFSEGFAISAIVALALMQFFKRKRGRWNPRP